MSRVIQARNIRPGMVLAFWGRIEDVEFYVEKGVGRVKFQTGPESHDRLLSDTLQIEDTVVA